MAEGLKQNRLLRGALMGVLAVPICLPAQTVRHHTEKVETDTVSAEVSQAEAAIEKKDFPAAEKLLMAATTANPKDAAAWYDLGSVYRATGRDDQALDAFKRAVALKPDSFDINRRIGMLLISQNKGHDAVPYVKAAIRNAAGNQKQFTSGLWSFLGLALEKDEPAEALAAFRHAIEADPKQDGLHLAAGRVLAQMKNFSAAETEYKAELALDPKSKPAVLGLAEAYRDSGRAKESGAVLEQYTKQFPDDPKVQFMFGQYLVSAGDPKGAMSHFEAALQSSPKDVELRHEIAAMEASKGAFPEAAAHYEILVNMAPDNAQYHYQYGYVLMQLHKFPEAQEQLIAALKRDGKILDAYDQLALAASENKQYPLAINVLDARSKLAAETAGTLFLRATAYDNLKLYAQAVENYHKFLEASNGQFPDNEWKARHRLIAIEPLQGKKKK